MARKLMTILFLLGLCSSVLAWVAQARSPVSLYNSPIPEGLPPDLTDLAESIWRVGPSLWRSSSGERVGDMGMRVGEPGVNPRTVTHSIGYAVLCDGGIEVGFGTETITSDDERSNYADFRRSFVNVYRVPLWSIVLVCALSSGLLIVPPVLRRRKRARGGKCLQCGYDLRGSTERCPECGTEFDADHPTLKADCCLLIADH